MPDENVVQISDWKKSRRRHLVTTVEIIIDHSRPLEEGDLVAWTWPAAADGKTWPTMLGYWWGPTGRDYSGRFVRKGSEDECCSLDVMKYTPKDLELGRLIILGRVIYGGQPEKVSIVLPPSAE